MLSWPACHCSTSRWVQRAAAVWGAGLGLAEGPLRLLAVPFCSVFSLCLFIPVPLSRCVSVCIICCFLFEISYTHLVGRVYHGEVGSRVPPLLSLPSTHWSESAEDSLCCTSEACSATPWTVVPGLAVRWGQVCALWPPAPQPLAQPAPPGSQPQATSGYFLRVELF